MLRIGQVKMPIDHNKKQLTAHVCELLHISPDEMTLSIRKRSVDARKKNDLHYVYAVDVSLRSEKQEEQILKRNKKLQISKVKETSYQLQASGQHKLRLRPVIVGSGPAGLAVADQLNKRGHNVTVFERSDRVGGLLMYGIPNMKLEKHIIDRKIKVMEQEGVKFVTNADIGKDAKSKKLVEGFDRVVLACGASNPRDINAPGRDAKGIYFAVDFLKGVTKSLLDSNLADNTYVSTKDKNVIIIGGGDTGNDCVGTSIRLGAKSVTQIEMMPKAPDTRAANNPWPEWPKICKTDYGQEEAIAVYGHDPRIYESTVKEFIKDKNGNLSAVKIVKLAWEKDPETGRMNMKEIEGSEQILEAQIVLIAAGFLGSQKYVTDAFKVELDARTNVKTAPGKFRTNVENVFVAGDMHTGQSLVVKAIRQGRECAHEVDESLMGYSNMLIQ